QANPKTPNLKTLKARPVSIYEKHKMNSQAGSSKVGSLNTKSQIPAPAKGKYEMFKKTLCRRWSNDNQAESSTSKEECLHTKRIFHTPVSIQPENLTNINEEIKVIEIIDLTQDDTSESEIQSVNLKRSSHISGKEDNEIFKKPYPAKRKSSDQTSFYTSETGRLKAKRSFPTPAAERYTILQNPLPGRMLLRRERIAQTAPSTSEIEGLKTKRSVPTPAKEGRTTFINPVPGRTSQRRESMVQNVPSTSKTKRSKTKRSFPTSVNERYTILQNPLPGRMLLRRESSVQTAPSTSKVECLNTKRSFPTPDKRSCCEFKKPLPRRGSQKRKHNDQAGSSTSKAECLNTKRSFPTPANIQPVNLTNMNNKDLIEIIDLTEDDDASKMKIQRAFFKGSPAIPDKEGPDIFKKPFPVRVMRKRKSSDPVGFSPSKIRIFTSSGFSSQVDKPHGKPSLILKGRLVKNRNGNLSIALNGKIEKVQGVFSSMELKGIRINDLRNPLQENKGKLSQKRKKSDGDVFSTSKIRIVSDNKSVSTGVSGYSSPNILRFDHAIEKDPLNLQCKGTSF
ncbi:hypothetical protein CDAR_510431, partial [Caerostris darwini]